MGPSPAICGFKRRAHVRGHSHVLRCWLDDAAEYLHRFYGCGGECKSHHAQCPWRNAERSVATGGSRVQARLEGLIRVHGLDDRQPARNKRYHRHDRPVGRGPDSDLRERNELHARRRPDSDLHPGSKSKDHQQRRHGLFDDFIKRLCIGYDHHARERFRDAGFRIVRGVLRLDRSGQPINLAADDLPQGGFCRFCGHDEYLGNGRRLRPRYRDDVDHEFRYCTLCRGFPNGSVRRGVDPHLQRDDLDSAGRGEYHYGCE